MNYIQHQKGLFERFVSDKRLSPFHISLYMALFQLWNSNLFRNPFPVAREEVMEKLAKGEKVTLDGMTGKNGKKFSAALQVDAANRSINFSGFKQEKGKDLEQKQEKTKGAKQKAS